MAVMANRLPADDGPPLAKDPGDSAPDDRLGLIRCSLARAPLVRTGFTRSEGLGRIAGAVEEEPCPTPPGPEVGNTKGQKTGQCLDWCAILAAILSLMLKVLPTSGGPEEVQ